ncbi:hypothetical protein [Dictyobacter arantiisoli]|nr:hypothetical protein [Dictyobacter arantiisoli]
MTSEIQIDRIDPMEDSTRIIWTPAFMLLFATLLGAGLSIASLVTHIWFNGHLYSVNHIGMVYGIVLLGIWLIVTTKAHAAWIRLGALFGCLWALFTIAQYWTGPHAINTQVSSMTQLQAASNSAMLASSLCLSVGRIQLRRWDTWLLWILPVAFCAYLGYSYLKAPVDTRSLLLIEGKIASLTIYLTIIIWWFRPQCWREQPGPASLFGLAPIILLLLNKVGAINSEATVFFFQIFFLCIFLGTVRILQAERHTQPQA